MSLLVTVGSFNMSYVRLFVCLIVYFWPLMIHVQVQSKLGVINYNLNTQVVYNTCGRTQYK